jgi:glycerol-3-phosphate cytidylyltransferase-like family protein
LDTRSKIISAGDLPLAEYAVVSGYFDPLLVSHVRRLLEIRKSHEGVVAVIQNSTRPVLPARARAELVAALDCVDYVLVGEMPRGGVVYHEEKADEERFAELSGHVKRRHRQA